MLRFRLGMFSSFGQRIRAAMLFPLAISGAEKVFHALFRLRRARLQVQVEQPLTLPSPEREGRSAAMQRHTGVIMCRIAAFLPEGYRGVYAGHPRVRELVDQERKI